MKTLGIIVVVLVLAGLGWYFYSTQYTGSPAESPSDNQAGPPQSESLGGEATVELTASGFSPAETTVKAGDTVKFVNKDAKNHWPASGVHPTHQLCPGFDAIGGVKPGESYSFTFTEKKECPIHDHLNPATRGKIIVQ